MSGGRLNVVRYDRWTDQFELAVSVLPEVEGCSRRLLSMLGHSVHPERASFFVVSDSAGPVGAVALRKRKRHWEPITQNICPRAIAPVREGRLLDVLEAVRQDIRIEYWDDAELPAGRVRNTARMPVYRFSADADHESYWRESGHWPAVRNARKYSARYCFEVDAPGAAEWVLNTWADRWSADPTRNRSIELLPDLLLAAPQLQSEGKLHAFTLRDGERFIAGYTFCVDRDRLISQRTVFDEQYRRDGVGTRVLDLAFQWVRESSEYKWIDLGGGHEYKARWAPQNGELLSFDVCPAFTHFKKQTFRAARSQVRAWKARLRS